MAYSIVDADMDRDQDLIVGLWQRNFEGSPEGRYEWIYLNNPYGKPITFLLKDESSGAIVGSYSLFPRKLAINGKSVQAYICGDLVVDTQHRSLGPAMTLIKAALKRSEEDGSVLFGFPNNLSGPVLIMSGFKDIGPRVQLTKVLGVEYLIKRYVNLAWLAKIISLPLDLFLLLRYGTPIKALGKYRFAVATEFDERFDQFNLKAINNFGLKGEISSEYLNWRFGQSPYGRNYVYMMMSKASDELLGYLVFTIKNNKISITDMSVLEKSYEEVNILLSSFHRFQKKKKVESISTEFAGDQKFLDKLLSNGFSVRSEELKTILYLPKIKNFLFDELLNDNWYLSAADNDI